MRKLLRSTLIVLIGIVMTAGVFACAKAKSYTITFEPNGGSAVTAVTAEEGAAITKPSDPTKADYTFDGWYKDSALTEKYTFPSAMPGEDVKLYAKWTAVKYAITFETNGGTAVTAITAEKDAAITKPADPTKANSLFDGWYKDSALTEKYTFPSAMPGENIKIYAKWKQSFTITFNSNGGSAVAAITQDAGSALTKPADPTRANQKFLGWFTDSACTVTYTFPSVMPVGDITLYAGWRALVRYTITFEVNGGSAVDPIQAYEGASISLFLPEDPERLTYTFGGWFDNEGLTGDRVTLPTVMPEENVTYYAKWVKRSYTISFTTSGGTDVQDITAEWGTAITAPAAPSRTGYTFDGWYDNQGLTGDAYTFTVMGTANTMLYAKWAAADSTLHFDSRGGSAVADVIAKTESTVTRPADPIKENCIFVNWFTDAGLTTIFNFTMPGGENTVYAKWQTIEPGTRLDLNYFTAPTGSKAYTVVNNPDGSISVTALAAHSAYEYVFISMPFNVKAFNKVVMTYQASSATALPFMLKVEGGGVVAKEQMYSTSGTGVNTVEWDLSAANLTNGVLPMTFIIFVNVTVDGASATTLKIISFDLCIVKDEAAQMNEAIFFDTGIGGSGVNPIIGILGSAVTMPTTVPTRPGYTFANGWTTDKAGTQDFTFNTMPKGPTKLYAKWTPKASQTITFNVDGGTPVADITAPQGAIIAAPEPPTRGGFVFGGWYKDAARTQEFKFEYMPSVPTTVYVKWNPNTMRTITLDSRGGSEVAPMVYPEGMDISTLVPVDPIKEDYTFKGWYTELEFTNKYTFSIMPNGNMTLYAMWEYSAEFTVSFNVKGGTAVDPITALGDSRVTMPADPTKSGFTFYGWYEDDVTFLVEWNGFMKIQNFTVYARWVTPETTTKVDMITATGWTRSTSSHWGVPAVNEGVMTASTAANKSATSYLYYRMTLSAKAYNAFEITMYADAADKTVSFALVYSGVTKSSDIYTMGKGAANAQTYLFLVDAANLTDGSASMDFRIYLPNHTGADLTITVTSLKLVRFKTEGAADQYYLDLNSSGGALVPRLFAAPGAAITLPVPVYPGRTLNGWFTEATEGTQFTDTVMPSANTTLYAQWTVNEKKTLTFDTVGGSAIAAREEIMGVKVSLPTNPTKTQCQFGGWYTDAAYTQPFDGYMPFADTTLYARWKVFDQATKINILAMDWSSNPATSYNVSRGANGSLIAGVTATKVGYDHLMASIDGRDLRGQGYLALVFKFKTTATNHTLMFKIEGTGVTAREYTPPVSADAVTGDGQTVTLVLTANNLSTTLTKFVIFALPGGNGDPTMTFQILSFDLYRYDYPAA